MKASMYLRLAALVSVVAAAPLGADEVAAAPAAKAPAAAPASDERITLLAEAQVDIRKRILAIMDSDKSEAEKLAEIKALFPECKSLGTKALEVGMARVLHKAQAINLPTHEERVRFAHWSAGVGVKDKALTQAIKDATNLSKGLPDLATIVALTPEQVADAFLGTMQTCTNRMLHEDMTNQQRIDFLEEMQHRLGVISIWVEETGKASDVTAILQSRFGVRTALRDQSVASQLSLANDANLARAALSYLMALDSLTRALYPES